MGIEQADSPPSDAHAGAGVPVGAIGALAGGVAAPRKPALAELGPPGVVVTDDLAIVQFRGQTGPFLEPAPGVASLDLLRLAREELRLPLRRTIDQARSTGQPAQERSASLPVGETRRSITVEVLPFAVHGTQERFFLVLFDDVDDVPPPDVPATRAGEAPTADAEPRALEGQLRQGLVSMRQYLEAVFERSAEYQDKLQRVAFDAALTEERERRRIAVELHDRIGQSLALAQIKLTSTRDAVSGAPRAVVDEVVALLADLLPTQSLPLRWIPN